MGLCLLGVLFDGRDHETLPRRSGTVFWALQVSVLQTFQISSTDRSPDVGEPLETTSQTPVPIAQGLKVYRGKLPSSLTVRFKPLKLAPRK